MSRRAAPVVTKAQLDRVAGFLKTMGVGAASVVVEPDKVRIVTTAGGDLTLSGDSAELDDELTRFRNKRGKSGPQRAA